MKTFFPAVGVLVAVAVFADLAAAAPVVPVKLSVGGSSFVYIDYAAQSSKYLDAAYPQGSHYNGFDVRGDHKVNFSGKSTLDNGLALSASTEIKVGGSTDGNTVKVGGWNVRADGVFGGVVLAFDSTASGSLFINSDGLDFKIFGGTKDNDTIGKTIILPKSHGVTVAKPDGVPFNNVGMGVDGVTGSGEGISYYTPALYGFTAGVSYHPDVVAPNSIKTNVGGAHAAVSPATTANQDAVSVGAQWKGNFSGLSLGVGGGYSAKPVGGAKKGVQYAGGNYMWGIGGQVGYKGFVVGGGFKTVEPGQDPTMVGTEYKDLDAPTAWEVGLGYSRSPFAVSLNYYQSAFPVTNKTSTAKATEDSVSQVQLSAGYALAKGIRLEAAIGYVAAEGAGYKIFSGKDKDAYKNSGVAVGTGLVLSF